jgi:ParB family chromosome partitioning protein
MTKKVLRPPKPRRQHPGKNGATVAISSIKVGKRYRRDMGDIAWLASSITDLGLLNPITVDEERRLLAGHRRLLACKQLGWKEIPVTVVRCAP